MVEGELAVSHLTGLYERLRPCFARSEPFAQAGRYVAGLLSDLPRKNGWTLAEHAGESRPDGMQRLLNHAVWDEQEAMRQVRSFVVEHLADAESLQVAALDESGQKKQGCATAGVQRQYMGCAGRVENGVNTVYCTYATPAGHALVGASVYLPAHQLDDPDRREQLGIDAEVEFQTKPQLARDLLAAMVADGTMPPWCAGDEVYGRSSELRRFCESNQIGYVLRTGCAFRATLASRVRLRADEAVARFLTDESWEIRSVPGSKGNRRYAWAWMSTTSHRHFLLIRKHLGTGELAYHYCHIPAARPVTLTSLVQVACLRWPVEEDFEAGKDHFGLDQSQVRLHTALTRHIVLTMAALAICAVTAVQATTRTAAPELPTRSDEEPPTDPGLIPLTVPEIKRLFILARNWIHDQAHHLHWHWWRRQHQARARWFHHRTRLQRAEQQP